METFFDVLQTFTIGMALVIALELILNAKSIYCFIRDMIRLKNAGIDIGELTYSEFNELRNSDIVPVETETKTDVVTSKIIHKVSGQDRTGLIVYLNDSEQFMPVPPEDFHKYQIGDVMTFDAEFIYEKMTNELIKITYIMRTEE